MNARILNAIKGRLSLRALQVESLEKLAHALDVAPGMRAHERDLAAILNTLKAEFPKKALIEFKQNPAANT